MAFATIFGGVKPKAPIIRTVAIEHRARGTVAPYLCREALSTGSDATLAPST